MRQSLCVAIMMIALGPAVWADDQDTDTWYHCEECFSVWMEDHAPCPVCRSKNPPVRMDPEVQESCPVCASVGVRTMNPRHAVWCRTCGIRLRQPRPWTQWERFRSHIAPLDAYCAAYVHGYIEKRGFIPTTEGDVRFESRLQLTWETVVSDTLDVDITVDVRGDTDNSAHGVQETLDDTRRTALGVRSANLTWRGTAVDVRLGKLMLPWGRADRINPTDPTPRDYTDLLDNEKIGVWGASATYAWGIASSFELVCLPWASPSILPTRESAWFLPPFDLAKRDALLRDIRNARGIGYGARFASTIASVDWSCSWFDGIETTPALRLSLPPHLVYHPYRAVGVDGETNVGGIGIRGEMAYRMHDGGRGDTSLRSIVGIDYRWEDVFRNRDSVHGFFSYARDDVFHEGTDIEYPYPFTHSLIGKIEYTRDEQTRFALSFVTQMSGGTTRAPDVRGGDWYVQPEVRQKIGTWEFSCGADILEGPKDSFFGFFGANDRITIGLKKEF